jgi:hypothetical protein
MFIFITAVLLWGCEDSVDPSISTGTINGTVKLNNSQSNDYSGVKVTLEGTSYSTISLSNGKWEIADVPAGVYKIVFSKSGYFLHEVFNFQFVGSGSYYLYSLTLAKIPSERVTQLNVQVIDSTKRIYFSGLISPPVQSQQTVVLLLSSDPFTQSIPIEAFTILGSGVDEGESEYGMSFTPEWYSEISTGDTLYAAAFLSDAQISGVSYNPIIEAYVFNTPDVYLSNVVNVLVP